MIMKVKELLETLNELVVDNPLINEYDVVSDYPVVKEGAGESNCYHVPTGLERIGITSDEEIHLEFC